MQITNTYDVNSNINVTLRVVPASVSNETGTNTTATTVNTQTMPPNNTTVNDIPVNQIPVVDDARSVIHEINILLQQFHEWIRVANESRRMEFLYNILLRENHETSDLFGKIMDIARRIMNGDEVTLEEMRFLQEQNPQLLYVVIMLKDDAAEVDDNERRREKERRRKDRRSNSRRREYSMRNHNLSSTRVIESMKFTMPRVMDKRIHKLLKEKSLKNSYINTVLAKTLSASIDEVISSPLDIAE